MTAMTRWQNSARSAVSALATTDGRWALVSTSLTAMIAGTIAFLAVGTMPPMKAHLGTAQTTFLPYQLFQKLAHSGNGTYASVAPFGPSAQQKVQVPVVTDDITDDTAQNKTPGVETRTI